MEDISFWVKVGSTITADYVPTKEEGLFIVDDYFSDGLTGVLKSKIMEGHCDITYHSVHGWLMFIYYAFYHQHELTQEEIVDLKKYTLERIKELNSKVKEKEVNMLDGTSVYFTIWFPEQEIL